MQQTNSNELPGVIQELKKYGVRFGLNSNRAYEDIVPIAERFGLDGPFLLENGACCMDTLDGKVVSTSVLPEGIPHTVHRLVRQLAARRYPNAIVKSVDTTAMVTNDFSLPGQHIFLNCFRKYSASIHHRFDGNMDPAVAKLITADLNNAFTDEKIELQAIAHEHGATITVEIPNIDKGTGLQFIKRLLPDATVIAIGDGIGDVSLRPHVDLLFAVANAIPELTSVADAVATETMTRGVVELLQTKVRPMAEPGSHQEV